MIEFDIICNVDHDSAAKFKLSFNFMTIQYGRLKRSQVIMETKNETDSWLPSLVPQWAKATWQE